MHVVQQLDLVAQPIAGRCEQPGRLRQVAVDVPAVRVRRAGVAAGRARRAIRARTGLAGLQPHVPVALGDQRLGVLQRGLDVRPGGVQVDRDGAAQPAAEQLVDSHPGAPAGDVPERHVDAGQGAVQHRTVAPVRGEVQHPGEVRDVRRVPAGHQRRDVLLERRHHGRETLMERRAAQAVQPRLGGVDPDHDEVDALGGGHDGADAGDPQSVAGRPGRLRLLERGHVTGHGWRTSKPSRSRAGFRSIGTLRPANAGRGTPGWKRSSSSSVGYGASVSGAAT